MHTIEIDFDVFKALTSRRSSEDVTYNEVLRTTLGLPAQPATPVSGTRPTSNTGDWVCKGVRFPTGTEFRARYNGQTILGKVVGGALEVNGKRYDSPSPAAAAITHTSINGWTFWECRIPGASSWRTIKAMRGNP